MNRIAFSPWNFWHFEESSTYCRPSISEIRKYHSSRRRDIINRLSPYKCTRNVTRKVLKMTHANVSILPPPPLPLLSQRSLPHPSWRVFNEAQLPRRVASNGLGKNVKHRCWPRNAYTRVHRRVSSGAFIIVWIFHIGYANERALARRIAASISERRRDCDVR